MRGGERATVSTSLIHLFNTLATATIAITTSTSHSLIHSFNNYERTHTCAQRSHFCAGPYTCTNECRAGHSLATIFHIACMDSTTACFYTRARTPGYTHNFHTRTYSCTLTPQPTTCPATIITNARTLVHNAHTRAPVHTRTCLPCTCTDEWIDTSINFQHSLVARMFVMQILNRIFSIV